MFLGELAASLDHVITGKGKQAAAALRALARLGILDVGALLRHYPRPPDRDGYEDRRGRRPLCDYAKGKVCTEVTVTGHEWFGYGAMKTLKVLVRDETARAVLVCFNRPFLAQQLPVGARVPLYGAFTRRYGEIQATAFDISVPEAGIVPLYPLSEGLTQKALRQAMRRAVDQYAARIEEELPTPILEKRGLLAKAKAITSVHFPATMDEVFAARKTLVYGELFYLEIIVGKRALERKTSMGGGAPPLGRTMLRPTPPSGGKENARAFKQTHGVCAARKLQYENAQAFSYAPRNAPQGGGGGSPPPPPPAFLPCSSGCSSASPFN